MSVWDWLLKPATALSRESEARGRAANAELERRFAEQTAELKAANASLTIALAERGLALQAAARTEEQFRVSFEAAAVGTAQMEPETTRIIRANAAFAHMLGYEPEQMVGRTIWDVTWPEDIERCQAEYVKLLAGEIPTYVGEKRCSRRDGQPLWVRISGTIARLPHTGEASITVAVIEDIDQRHKAQVASETAKADLEIVVRERTAALHQRDVLLREVYHRVKNNLQVIDGLLVMQAKKLADAEARAALGSLRGRIHALGLVHHQLMNSANLKTFDIAPFLQELSANIIDGGGSGGIHLSVEAAPLEVGLDFAIPLGLLVTELVTNSIKHAFPGGEGNIVVKLERRSDGEVALVVADDGHGWSGDQTSLGGGAPGLGTSIIRGLVAQLGGVLTMATQNGVRIEIRVPAPVLA